jgi:hypothetical protein
MVVSKKKVGCRVAVRLVGSKRKLIPNGWIRGWSNQVMGCVLADKPACQTDPNVFIIDVKSFLTSKY